MIYLKCWTPTLRPLKVYPKVLCLRILCPGLLATGGDARLRDTKMLLKQAGRRSPQCPQVLKVGGIFVYLKYWTLNIMPLMVYPKVLSRLYVSIKANARARRTWTISTRWPCSLI